MPGCRVCRSAIEPFIDFGRMPLGQRLSDRRSVRRTSIFFNLSAACLSALHAGAAGRAAAARADVQRSLSVLLRHVGADAGALCGAGARRHRDTAGGRSVRRRNRQQRRHAAASRRAARASVTSASSRRASVAQRGDAPRRQHDLPVLRCGDWRAQIVAEHGQADAIIAANALSHIADLHSVVEGIGDPARAGRHLRDRGSVLGRRRRPDRLRSDLRRARVVFHAVVVVVICSRNMASRCSTRRRSTCTADRCAT